MIPGHDEFEKMLKDALGDEPFDESIVIRAGCQWTVECHYYGWAVGKIFMCSDYPDSSAEEVIDDVIGELRRQFREETPADLPDGTKSVEFGGMG